jgi:aspartate racemase
VASVGIVGGLGPESTIDYYRRILQVWQEHTPRSAPVIMIDSLDVDLGLRLIDADRPGLTAYLLESLQRLSRAGVDFAVLAANSPHVVFDDLSARSPVPLLSIVEVCAREAARQGIRKLGLLGTRFTMDGTFYPATCAPYGIEVVVPEPEERAWIHERYIGELLRGVFREETRKGVLGIIERLRDRTAMDGIALAGTELPLLLRSPSLGGVPVLDTTELHVAAIVERLRG